jgi:hypothetical protein
VRILAGVLIAALALLGAGTGCGGGAGGESKPLSRHDLISEANRICHSANSQVNKLREPKNRQDVVPYLSSAVAVGEKELRELRQLRPPNDVRPRWTQYLSLLAQEVAKARKATQEFRSGQAAAGESTMNAVDKIDGRSADIVYALGAHRCAAY